MAELVNTVVRFVFVWAGWIVAVAVAVAAGFSAWYARRSARAAEGSLEESRRSVRAAEESAEVARKALRHDQESEARDRRSKLATAAADLDTAYAEANDLAEKLLDLRKGAGARHGKTELHRLAIVEAEKIPGELKAIFDGVDRRNLAPDALRDFPIDDIEDLAATIHAAYRGLERWIASLKRDLRIAEEQRQRELDLQDPFRTLQ